MKEIILGLVQGLTEFLPVSSSGHLTIFSEFMNLGQNISYFAILHLATFFAVLLFVWREVFDIIKGIFTLNKNMLNLAGKLIVSTIPAIFAAFLLDDFFENIFSSIFAVATFLFITGIMMFLSDNFDKDKKDMQNISYKDALIIGLVQALAILPGISRSGLTLFAALFLGMKRKEAVKYSFLMSLPVTFGAGILKLEGFNFNIYYFLGTVVAFLSGILGLYILKKTVLNGKLKFFAYYCFSVSIFTFIYFGLVI